ncbi:helicase-related protein [Paenibacillus tarimensis]
MEREEAIRRLAAGSLKVIFTVDLFNERTDISAVDTLLFTRPTESLTVFTQQVGRGCGSMSGRRIAQSST